MQFGHFDDAKKEYVITSPKTPLPWINYLGSENFFSLISNTCGGYSFYKDAKLLRLTRYRYNDTPLDQNGRYYYIKDGDTVWNPGWQPTQTPLDSYECHHGLGYSRFVSSKNLVAAELRSRVLRFTTKLSTASAADITLFMQSTARSTDTIPTATLSLVLTAETTARRPFCAAQQATPLPADGVSSVPTTSTLP